MPTHHKVKTFSRYPKKVAPLPGLIDVQRESYKRFIDEGLQQLFNEISPIRDYSEKEIELHFTGFRLEDAKHDEVEAKRLGLSYEAPMRASVKMVNKISGEIKEQDIFLTDFPLMTPRGTFIVNGVERVIVSQLIRSSGVFFTVDERRGEKVHGAKVIPNHGAWLEFETRPGGVISVKIDRKRRVAVTSLLRVFGLETNDDIRKAFKKVDTGETSFIEATLEDDEASDQIEGYIEVYKRIRPGDPATPDNARQLIDGMFFNPSRYDLAEVGRFKLNQRLELDVPITLEKRLLQLEDLIGIVSELIRLNRDPTAGADDIDHLANRRVRTFGELLAQRLRTGLGRMERIARDRISTLDLYSVAPSQLINSRPFIAAVKEFFSSSQLSQFMDQENPLAELEHKRRLSAMGPGGLTRERAGFEVRDVHVSHYGRICPIQTPEGPNIGLTGQLATYARLNPYGFIETPYHKVVKGKISEKIVYLNAAEDARSIIAHAGVAVNKDGRITGNSVQARVRGTAGLVTPREVDYIDISPYQSISVATALIPFLEHDDANRALMGSNMQRQAASLVHPEAPLVGTGLEERAAQDSGQVVLSETNGVVESVDANRIVIRKKGAPKNKKSSKIIYTLQSFERSNQGTSLDHRPLVALGETVKKGQTLADGAATDQGVLALGQNMLVAFMSWGGQNFEDAIVISERVLKDDRYSSVHIEEHDIDVRDTKLGPEVTTPDIPNIGEDRLKDLDEEGIIRVGAEVGPGDILVGKISPKGEVDLTAEERLLRAIFGEKARDVKDVSLTMSHGKRGRVVGVKVFSREEGHKLPSGVIKTVKVEVAQFRRIRVGDKLAGRHGNKGVISVILPEEDMPYLEDGTPVDVVLNPLGVASRMNIGQNFEAELGIAAQRNGYRVLTPPFAGVTEEEIREELKKAGLPESGKVILHDGRTGEQIEQPVAVGVMYILKLMHLVEDKIHMRAIGPYSLITQQPLGGKAQFGGQRFGEMEVWALEGYGAAYTLQEMLTIKSDDVMGRARAYDSIINGRPIRNSNIPASFHVLVSEMKALGLNVEMLSNGEVFKPEHEV